jgi:hypothetical protein
MPLTLIFIHHREVRRFKTIEAESVEDGEKLYQAFVESAGASDDSAWDEIEDDDPGESELREICGETVVDELDTCMASALVCRTCGERIPDDDLRTHLAGHHPGAWAFDVDQVRDCYGEWP